MRSICNCNGGAKRRCRDRSKRAIEDNRSPSLQRSYVVIHAALANVKLQIGANANQVCAAQRDPVPQRAAHAKKCVGVETGPPADLLGVALTKTNLVALIPATLRRVAGVFAVDARFKQCLLKWHVEPLVGIFALNSEKGNARLGGV